MRHAIAEHLNLDVTVRRLAARGELDAYVSWKRTSKPKRMISRSANVELSLPQRVRATGVVPEITKLLTVKVVTETRRRNARIALRGARVKKQDAAQDAEAGSHHG